ncbi:MAG: Holliday junction resolvase RuvX [Kiritimatiellae bacterium]|nr:Holliday junction resolvase RuvX [Kiritimatiellia bacterium]MDD5521255.1 Holliday junction resolvase RuvX [Kiritimatiellia bacterium]
MRIIGLDYGDVRLGFAMSDPAGIISMPLCMVELKHGLKAETEVKRICEEHDAEKLVIGLPLNMNASAGPMALKVEAFIERLKPILKIPIEKWDERLSTSLVERMLVEESDMSRAKRKGVRDKLAAQVILQGYLDKCNMSNNTSGDEQV